MPFTIGSSQEASQETDTDVLSSQEARDTPTTSQESVGTLMGEAQDNEEALTQQMSSVTCQKVGTHSGSNTYRRLNAEVEEIIPSSQESCTLRSGLENLDVKDVDIRSSQECNSIDLDTYSQNYMISSQESQLDLHLSSSQESQNSTPGDDPYRDDVPRASAYVDEVKSKCMETELLKPKKTLGMDTNMAKHTASPNLPSTLSSLSHQRSLRHLKYNSNDSSTPDISSSPYLEKPNLSYQPCTITTASALADVDFTPTHLTRSDSTDTLPASDINMNQFDHYLNESVVENNARLRSSHPILANDSGMGLSMSSQESVSSQGGGDPNPVLGMLGVSDSRLQRRFNMQYDVDNSKVEPNPILGSSNSGLNVIVKDSHLKSCMSTPSVQDFKLQPLAAANVSSSEGTLKHLHSDVLKDTNECSTSHTSTSDDQKPQLIRRDHISPNTSPMKRPAPQDKDDTSATEDPPKRPKLCTPRKRTKTNSESYTNLCQICFSKPKEASLIHGKTGHQVCCYTCAKKLRRHGKPCPVCRRPIQRVIKNFLV